MTDSSSTRNTPSSSEIALEFVALHEHLSDSGDRPTALRRLVMMAVGFVPGCDYAGITAWPPRNNPRTLAASDETTLAVDQLQYDLGDGPCLHVVADTGTVLVPDITDDDRWPAFFAGVLADTPVRGVLAFHLANEPVRCCLNLYSRRAGALTSASVAAAVLFAAHARVLLMHADSTDKVANLGTALSTSRQIGAAVGILMGAHKITNDEAFELLRMNSQRLHRKLRDIADDVLHTGTLPGS